MLFVSCYCENQKYRKSESSYSENRQYCLSHGSENQKYGRSDSCYSENHQYCFSHVIMRIKNIEVNQAIVRIVSTVCLMLVRIKRIGEVTHAIVRIISTVCLMLCENQKYRRSDSCYSENHQYRLSHVTVRNKSIGEVTHAIVRIVTSIYLML